VVGNQISLKKQNLKSPSPETSNWLIYTYGTVKIMYYTALRKNIPDCFIRERKKVTSSKYPALCQVKQIKVQLYINNNNKYTTNKVLISVLLQSKMCTIYQP